MSIMYPPLHTTVSLSYHPLAARPPGARARAHPDHSWPWSSEALLAGHAVWARFERPLALLHRPQPAPRPAAPTLQHRWGRRRPRPPSLAPAPPWHAETRIHATWPPILTRSTHHGRTALDGHNSNGPGSPAVGQSSFRHLRDSETKAQHWRRSASGGSRV